MVERLHIDWHPVIPVPIAATAAGLAITARPCRLYGWSLVETTGAAIAACDLIDGGAAAGTEITPITLSAGQSTRDWLGRPGLLVQSGLFLNVTAGTVRGAVWILLLTEAEILKGNGDYADIG